MSWNKKATAAYHFIEAADDDYFINLQNSFDAIFKSGETSGTFDSSSCHFIWKINSKENLADSDTFFISLVKERASWPVWFNESGEIGDVPITEGSLGELYYAFINPSKKFMISMSALGGAAAGSFKKMLSEFSTDGGVKIVPLYEEGIDKKVLAWDYFKKLHVTMTFPTHDDLAEFKTTYEGGLLPVVDELGGLKIDFTVSAPKSKQMLNAAQVKSVVRNLLTNDFCDKIALRGSDFETESVDEYDLMNAQIKYNELIDVSGTFMSSDEAKAILMHAYGDRARELLMIL